MKKWRIFIPKAMLEFISSFNSIGGWIGDEQVREYVSVFMLSEVE